MKFFPSQKLAKLRNEINTFSQKDEESLYNAWERFKELLKKCPYHAIPDQLQIQTFYNWLILSIRSTVHATSRGSLHNKTLKGALQLIETMATNNFMASNERSLGRRGVLPYLLRTSSCLSNWLLSTNNSGKCRLELQVLSF